MKNLKLFAAAVAMGLLVVGCGTIKKPQTVAATPQPVQNIGDDIEKVNKILNGQWNVVNVNGQAVVGDDRPYVVFDTIATNPFLSKIYAYNGCNVINGTVAVNPSGTMKKASDYLSTMKYCPDAAYEIGVSMVLENISRFKIEKIGKEYILYLTGADGKQSLILRRGDLGFINGAWAVTRVFDRVVGEDAGIEMVIDIPEMKVHGNGGCNVLNGELFINPDIQHSLQFINVATTRMTCPNAELEGQFLEALREVATVEEDHSANNAIMRDASGNLVLELKRIDLRAQAAN